MKTTIAVSVELRNFLEKQAIRKGETYDLILRRLLEEKWNIKIPPETDSNQNSLVTKKGV